MEPTGKLEKETQNLTPKFRLLQLITYRPRESAAFNLPSSDKLIKYLKLQNLMAEGHQWAWWRSRISKEMLVCSLLNWMPFPI